MRVAFRQYQCEVEDRHLTMGISLRVRVRTTVFHAHKAGPKAGEAGPEDNLNLAAQAKELSPWVYQAGPRT